MKTVLTIAGTDPDSGAGLQADLKTFAALGVHGTSVVTAVVAQNRKEVRAVHALPARFVGTQIDTIMADMPSVVWKIGMLANGSIVKIVAAKAKKHSIEKLVVDPVLKASSGGLLFAPSAIKILITKLLPRTFVVTPNVLEAEKLTGLTIGSLEDIKHAAVVLSKMGVKHVVIKGGHIVLGDTAVDILFDGKRIAVFSGPRLRAENAHGTGCAFASAIAAGLAKGKTVTQSVSMAKRYVLRLLSASK